MSAYIYCITKYIFLNIILSPKNNKNWHLILRAMDLVNWLVLLKCLLEKNMRQFFLRGLVIQRKSWHLASFTKGTHHTTASVILCQKCYLVSFTIEASIHCPWLAHVWVVLFSELGPAYEKSCCRCAPRPPSPHSEFAIVLMANTNNHALIPRQNRPELGSIHIQIQLESERHPGCVLYQPGLAQTGSVCSAWKIPHEKRFWGM